MEDVERGMPSSPLCSTHTQTMLGVRCHHCAWATHTEGRCRACHGIIALTQHTRSDNVGRIMPLSPLASCMVRRGRVWHARMDLRQHTSQMMSTMECFIAFGHHTRSDDIYVACHHQLWTIHKAGRCRAWHAIIALVQYKLSNEVGR